ncbi:hypothetical protein IRZ83_15225 [Flavobacterium sp. JLP]|uniref:hypothetical protein n=1 Tax=unclassified Flavobacterium TaxID=196869 RepID=UPI00188D749F|nr:MULTISPECIES: hypothetical protein [unclassified Flavobacterium]MBF4493512.1 hypothetical protein [Flavobacterium sp. MR2016-29]MBF4508026.1 hypothetical protein [Flavobacterium sp. JLP]
MRRILISFIIMIISGCGKTNKKEPQNNVEIIPKTETSVETETTDSLNLKEKFLDTTNIKTSPVKILSSKLFKNEYSDHKDIQLIYKNVSKTDIKAIKFEWYCENSFDKPASGRSFFIKGEYTGETTFLLKKQNTAFKIWEDFSTDANTIIAARAYEVIFTNGTKWKLRQ